MEPATQPAGEGEFTKALRSAQGGKKHKGGCLASAAHALLVAACALLLLTTAAVSAAFVLLYASGGWADDANKPFLLLIILFLAMPGAVWLVASNKGATGHLRLAAAYALLNWALRLPVALYPIWSDRVILAMILEGTPDTYRFSGLKAEILLCHCPLVSNTMRFMTCCFLFGMIFCGFWMAIVRLRALERSCLTDLHSKHLVRLFSVACPVIGIMALLLLLGRYDEAIKGLAPLLILLLCLGLPTFLQGRAAQARNMHAALRREILCLVLMVATSATLIALWVDEFLLATRILKPTTYVTRAVELLDVLCNEWYALNLSGALSGAMRSAKARAAVAKGRKRRRQAAEAQWSKRKEAGENVDWDEKVSELAGRAISLQALLLFFRKLPSLMESYTPDRHSTNDVVRGAIVPFTAEARESGATVLMEGKFTTPDKMVTHNWSNLFLDLIAAVLADALGEGEFIMISSLLKSDLDRLQKWVDHAQVGGRTYWICAFSVNQHLGICASVRPTAKDTVTGVRPTPCACGLEKALNHTEPLLPDGRSIPCEMNKFDDMMKFLAAANPAFEQVVAIDAKFSLFSRAWCVAEIATANGTGMLQSLKISSREAMSERAEQLRGIRIQDMEASRKEDKDEILASIEDLEAFNANLQDLLFKDLFPAWSSLDAEERLVTAGTMIRWLPVWAADATRAQL